jgi:hypothetical protein
MILELGATFNFERFHGLQTKVLRRAGPRGDIRFSWQMEQNPAQAARHRRGWRFGFPLNKVIEKCTY